ncbi:MAG: glycosyltransferase family 39 protein [Ardenticatenaceae bacterium]|nr:glycosyltransferase family 39 protein [Ardenticatenaceae bacterium]
MKKWWWLALLPVLLIAAALRLTGLDWDGYNHYHPDERYITWVATTIEAPTDWRTALNPAGSTFNPFYWPAGAVSEGIEVLQDQPRSFAYGHLPLYLGVAATRLVESVAPVLRDRLPAGWLLTRDLLNGAGMIEFRHLTAVARALTGLVDVATVALVFGLGRALFGTPAGLLAAAFLALNVMHIQLAHFFVVDPYLTLFTVAALLLLVLAVQRPGRGRTIYLLLAAVSIGLAVGSKFSAAMLFLPLAVTLWLDRSLTSRQFWLRLAGLALLAGLVFFASNPFAVLDWSCPVVTPAGQWGPLRLPALDWRSCYLENVARQGAMVGGELDAPFARQYTGTWPYLYPIEMQLRWGMGPLLGGLAFAGFAWAVWRGVCGAVAWWQSRHDPLAFRPRVAGFQTAEWIVLAWTVPYFLTTGAFFVKFMRYLQPLTPFLMVYAAGMVWQWRPRGRSWPRVVLAGVTLLVTGLYALSFVNMYAQPHPWTAASQWIYAQVPAGALILSEQWDDALPTSLVDDELLRSRYEYRSAELTWLSGADAQDDRAKLEANLTLLAAADYVTLISNRVYGVVPRLPARYPLSSQYAQLLFDGRLGYEVVYVSGRFPSLGGFSLKPDSFGWPGLVPPRPVADYLAGVGGVTPGRADESFTVYDQPLTMVLRNTGRMTVAEMLAQFALP